MFSCTIILSSDLSSDLVRLLVLCFVASVIVHPQAGNMLGGTGVYIHTRGICEEESIQCFFGTNVVTGRRLSKTLAVCVSPLLQRSGNISLEVVFESGKNVISQFMSCKLSI